MTTRDRRKRQSGFGFDYVPGLFEKALDEMYLPMARAATLAVREAGETLKTEVRASIRAGGFSTRWQNAWRVDVFPKPGTGKFSVNAAAFAYHNIWYAGVFEEGTRIATNKLLWLPLPGTPKRYGGKRFDVKAAMRASGGKLQSFRSKSGLPLLGVRVRVSRRKARQATPRVTMPEIIRGRGSKGQGVLRTIPLFVGKTQVQMPKKFSITPSVEKARDSLAELYVKNLVDE